MDGVQDIFDAWRRNKDFDDETRKELDAIKNDKDEWYDRFYKNLEFGTGGLRGLIGAGTNRMNIFTVRKITQGTANYLHHLSAIERPSVVIAYDSRIKSAEFAAETASVFAGNHIKVYLFDSLRPTPELSFAIRYLHASIGVVITASHNPKEYNGYKIYNANGGQMTVNQSNAVSEEIAAINDFTKIYRVSMEEAAREGLLQIVSEEVDGPYMKMLERLDRSLNDQEHKADTSIIVYTPLHGAGGKLVTRILKETGFQNIFMVKEQEKPDGNFPTVKTPNPEEKESYALAIEYAKKINADLIIATDPDADRVGAALKNQSSEYTLLTGNQIGCLLLDYILSIKKDKGALPANGFIVKTLVSTPMADAIAQNYGVEIFDVPTGFKNIGEQISLLDDTGTKKYLFGFEESYGYLADTFVRDKDGIAASMLICKMNSYYKQKGITLWAHLEHLYRKYCYYFEGLLSYTLPGNNGSLRINQAVHSLRSIRPNHFGKIPVISMSDYLTGERQILFDPKTEPLTFPFSNVLRYQLSDSSWVCVRPSGTEPKLKIYYGVHHALRKEAQRRFKALERKLQLFFHHLLYDERQQL